MATQRFESGKSAMGWLTGKKTPAQLDAEIAAELDESRGPVLTRGSTTPLPPFPGPRTPRQTRAAVAKAPKARGTMTSAEFLKSLPPPLHRRGAGSSSVPEVAKTIRREVEAAVAAGALPLGTKVSVTSDHNSIRVEVTRWEGEVFSKAYTEHLMDPKTSWDPEYRTEGGRARDARLSKPLQDALAFIERLADRHNYHNSDTMTDFFDEGYYLSVGAGPVENIAQTAIKTESSKEFRALMDQARDAAAALGPAATKSICGDKDLMHADEYCIKKLLKLAERAAGRPVVHDPRRGWIVDDGSTAKVAALPKLQLGKTIYGIAGGSVAEAHFTLIGPRGSHSYLVRARANKTEQERGEPSKSWSHNINGKSTWWTRNPDGTFGNPH